MTELEAEKTSSIIEGLFSKHTTSIKENLSLDYQNEIKSQIESQMESFKVGVDGQINALKASRTPYEREDIGQGNSFLKGLSSDYLAKGWAMNASEKSEIRQKATVTVGSMINTSTLVIPESRKPGIVFEPSAPEHVRDFMKVEGTDSDTHTHSREQSFTDAAGFVIPNGNVAFGKADFTLTTVNTPMFDCQVGLDIHKNILRDLPQLNEFVSSRLTTKFYLKEDFFLLYGDGTVGVISGINVTAAPFNAGTRRVTTPQIVDALLVAKLQNRKRNYQTTVIMLNPEETTTIDLIKDTQGRYLDARAMLPTIWESTLVAPNSFITADTTRGGSIIERTGLELSVSADNKDNFEKGLLTFRLEKRFGLAKYYSESFVKGTLTGAGGAIAALTAA